MPTSPDTFTVTCNGIGAIGIDYVDAGSEPDEDIIYAFVTFRPRLAPGTTIWAPGLTPPRGIELDDVKARFSPEDGKLRTIVGKPSNEKQLVTVTAGGPFTLTYAGQTTTSIAGTGTAALVKAALEALPNIGVGDVFVSGAAVNEKQTVTCGGGSTGGYFLLTFDGQTTAPISRNSSAPGMQAALQSLSNIGLDGVSVSGPTGGPWVVEFTGTLAGTNVNQMVGSQRSEVQVIAISGTPIGGEFQLTYAGQTTAVIAYNASAATVQAALEALSNIAPGDIVVTGAAGGPWTVAFTGTLANQDVALITPVNERNEVQTVAVTTGTPTGGSFTLTYGGSTTAPIPRFSSAGTVRTALEALPGISPGDISVSGGGFLGEGPWVVKFQGNLLGQQNIAQMTAASSLTPSGTVTVTTTTAGLGVIGGTVVSDTTVTPVYLTPSGTVTVATTVAGSTGTPYTVSFTGTLAATDVAQMTATGATVTTVTPGTGDLGVKLIANTALLDLDELIYDIEFDIPQRDRVLQPFAILAPTTTGQVLDLSTVPRLPHRSQ